MTNVKCEAHTILRSGSESPTDRSFLHHAVGTSTKFFEEPQRLIEEGVQTLTELSGLIAAKNLRGPAFTMVVTAVGDYAYARKEDGVIVCPLSALRP